MIGQKRAIAVINRESVYLYTHEKRDPYVLKMRFTAVENLVVNSMDTLELDVTKLITQIENPPKKIVLFLAKDFIFEIKIDDIKDAEKALKELKLKVPFKSDQLISKAYTNAKEQIGIITIEETYLAFVDAFEKAGVEVEYVFPETVVKGTDLTHENLMEIAQNKQLLEFGSLPINRSKLINIRQEHTENKEENTESEQKKYGLLSNKYLQVAILLSNVGLWAFIAFQQFNTNKLNQQLLQTIQEQEEQLNSPQNSENQQELKDSNLIDYEVAVNIELRNPGVEEKLAKLGFTNITNEIEENAEETDENDVDTDNILILYNTNVSKETIESIKDELVDDFESVFEKDIAEQSDYDIIIAEQEK